MNGIPNESLFSTLAKEAHAEFTEKRSRFIGHARPVSCEKDALDFIARVRHEYADATHNVYAYMLRENNIARYSDAGEPQGTAGIPVLEVIKKLGVTDCVIVVTRYFGGVLLGAGGLVRAYGTAAKAACDAAGTVEFAEFTEFTVEADYSDFNKIKPILSRFDLKTDGTDYAENVVLRLAARAPDYEAVRAAAVEATAGRAKVTLTGKRVDF